jgi:hypothetical protein
MPGSIRSSLHLAVRLQELFRHPSPIQIQKSPSAKAVKLDVVSTALAYPYYRDYPRYLGGPTA